jgi:hypothetical protein
MLGGCNSERSRPLTTIQESAKQGIVYDDIGLEIDPENKIFRSQQRVTITGNLAEGKNWKGRAIFPVLCRDGDLPDAAGVIGHGKVDYRFDSDH